MRTIVLATQNQNKVTELIELIDEYKLDNEYQVKSLKDLDILNEVEEDGLTLKENAYLKAFGYNEIVKDKLTDYLIIADDTGLFVDSLNGEPGIYSARYSGDNATYASNRKLLLERLGNNENRSAHFESVICMIDHNKVTYFSGKTTGHITTEEIGTNGFGYDSIFYSDELCKVFGVSSLVEKSSVSHRGKAFKEFIKYLRGK